MTWQDLLSYCLAKPGAWQDEPWEDDVVVKVGCKIFAFLGSGTASAVGLKCGPTRESADEWLLRYPRDASVIASIFHGNAITQHAMKRAIVRYERRRIMSQKFSYRFFACVAPLGGRKLFKPITVDLRI